MPETSCSLYLISPEEIDLKNFPDLFKRLADKVSFAAFLLKVSEEVTDEALSPVIERLFPIAAEFNTAFMLYNRPYLVKKTGVDGVHLSKGSAKNILTARRLAGDEISLGVDCGVSFDQAMQSGEASADYVMFEAFSAEDQTAKPNIDLFQSWSLISTLPCVAKGEITPENCRIFAEAGADFITLGDILWRNPEKAPETAALIAKNIKNAF